MWRKIVRLLRTKCYEQVFMFLVLKRYKLNQGSQTQFDRRATFQKILRGPRFKWKKAYAGLKLLEKL